MNKKYLQTALISASILVFGIGTMSNSSGPGGDRAGAPGSSGNCSACHGGGSNNGGDLVISAVDIASAKTVTAFEAGKKYTIGIKMGGTSLRKGFQATVLDASNKFVGSVSNVSSGATSYAAGTRTMVGHSTPGLGIWYFDWTAPSTAPTNVTIYASGIVSNSNFNNSGDQVIAATLVLSAPVASLNSVNISSIKIHPNPASNQLHFGEELQSVQLLSTNGKLVLRSENTVDLDIRALPNGLYFVQGINASGKAIRGQFIKQ